MKIIFNHMMLFLDLKAPILVELGVFSDCLLQAKLTLRCLMDRSFWVLTLIV
jgi:hypothetical protein